MLEIFLYVILHDDNSRDERFRFPMPSMEVCQATVTNGKITMPAKVGGDYEVMGVMFCGSGKIQRHSNNTWWKDAIKTHDGGRHP